MSKPFDAQSVITIICLFLAVMAWGIRLEGKVDSSIVRFQDHLKFIDKRLNAFGEDIKKIEDKMHWDKDL